MKLWWDALTPLGRVVVPIALVALALIVDAVLRLATGAVLP